MAQPRRYYLLNSEIGFDEDDMHEFKAHRSMCVESIPGFCVTHENNRLKRSRQAVSKTICAFLNTAKGGICYLGVMNEGIVTGIKLTQYQRDHVILELDDLLKRFEPAVPAEQVKVTFKPVLNQDVNAEKLEKILKECNRDDDARLKRDHTLRTSLYCWCDKSAAAEYNCGTIMLSYVIEITVLPWNGANRLSIKAMLHPFYQNEEGLCFIRRQASNVSLTLQEVYDITKSQVYNYYHPEIFKLESELKILRDKAERVMRAKKQQGEASAKAAGEN